MVEILGWISSQHTLTLSSVDRFPDVVQNDATRVRAKLETHFGTPKFGPTSNLAR